MRVNKYPPNMLMNILIISDLNVIMIQYLVILNLLGERQYM